MILFIHETKHIGGGQSFVNAYKKIFQENNTSFDFFEDSINAFYLMKKLFSKKYNSIFLNIYTPKFLPLILLSKSIRVQSVMTVYGIWFLELHSQHPTLFRKKKLWLRITQGLYFLMCNKLIVFSEYEKKLVEYYYPFTKNKIVIIPGGVDTDLFFPLSANKKNAIRKQLFLPEKVTIFLFLSRLDRRKGVHLAIGAFYEVLKKHPDSLLCIVFPSNKFTTYDVIYEAFRQVSDLKIGDKVHFITGVPQNQIQHYFQSSDIFLMSSTDLETFGLTTIEAAASGCIPIGFKSGSTPEHLNQIHSGLVVSKINSKAMAHTIGWVLSLSSANRQKLKQKSTDLAKKYTWENITLVLIKTLLKR